jgi:3-methyladenine DNA glycosylase AlkD
VLNEIAKSAKEGGFELIEQLWEAGAYEERMLAAKMLNKVAKKDPDKAIKLVYNYSFEIDNWALCDTLGMQSLKSINKIKTKDIFQLSKTLSKSDLMWQRRLSMVLLEDFCKQPNLHPAIKEIVVLHKNDKEYYIKKAVAWLTASLGKQ